jgi:CBS domain-containing protein
MIKVEKIMRRDVGGVSGVPVVHANRGLIGIVTDSDLIVRLIPRRTPRWWDGCVVRPTRRRAPRSRS